MGKLIDKEYCMSSFLAFRYVVNPEMIFEGGVEHIEFTPISESKKTSCKTIEDIDECIRKCLDGVDLTDAGILLSGGIDSGILASYMPKGTPAYTVSNPNPAAVAEVERAAKVCRKFGLEHHIIDVTWKEYDDCMDELMRHDGCPVFANEPQVYIVAERMKKDGVHTIIYGDNADMAFGGMDRMLSRDWSFDEWVNRYTFVDPKDVLVSPIDMNDVYETYRVGDNGIDFIKFISEIFAMSSSGAYINAFDYIGMQYVDPYAYMKMAEPLDLNRVRAGDSKYMLRELYREKFPGWEVPEKIAMARAMDVWLKNWKGPIRKEFKRDCMEKMTGEQKFMIYSLERFLNLMDIK